MSMRPSGTDARPVAISPGVRARPAWRLAAAALLVAVAALGIAPQAPATGADGAETTPAHRLRIAYYQGGDYSEYHDLLVATAQALGAMGLIDASGIPEETHGRARPVWEWLSRTDDGSDRLEFLADGFYSAEWDEGLRRDTRLELLHRLRAQADIDLVLAFGTWAGKDLANDRHATPVLVISASDAVGAGIVASVEDSGFDHVHAHLDPHRIERQVRLFHDAVGFESLGIAYEDTPDGRTYAGMSQIEALAGGIDSGLGVMKGALGQRIDESFLLRKCVRRRFIVTDPVSVVMDMWHTVDLVDRAVFDFGPGRGRWCRIHVGAGASGNGIIKILEPESSVFY